jgi:hypothetical protein
MVEEPGVRLGQPGRSVGPPPSPAADFSGARPGLCFGALANLARCRISRSFRGFAARPPFGVIPYRAEGRRVAGTRRVSPRNAERLRSHN